MKSKVLGAGPPDPLPDDDEAVGGGCSHSISAVLCPHLRWASRKAQIQLIQVGTGKFRKKDPILPLFFPYQNLELGPQPSPQQKYTGKTLPLGVGNTSIGAVFADNAVGVRSNVLKELKKK